MQEKRYPCVRGAPRPITPADGKTRMEGGSFSRVPHSRARRSETVKLQMLSRERRACICMYKAVCASLLLLLLLHRHYRKNTSSLVPTNPDTFFLHASTARRFAPSASRRFSRPFRSSSHLSIGSLTRGRYRSLRKFFRLSRKRKALLRRNSCLRYCFKT